MVLFAAEPQYWLNTTEKDPVLFAEQVQTVCNTYLEAPDLFFQCNTHTVSVDAALVSAKTDRQR